MRSSIFLFAIATFATTAFTDAQDATQSAVNPPSGAVEETSPPGVPSPTPALPELSTLDQAFNQTGLGKDADEMRMRIEMRKLQNDIARDPAVVAARAAAEAAPTDLEKRERLHHYYDINYGLMSSRASSADLKAAIAKLRQEHEALLAQPRVRPGTGEAPAPTPKKKKRKSGKRF